MQLYTSNVTYLEKKSFPFVAVGFSLKKIGMKRFFPFLLILIVSCASKDKKSENAGMKNSINDELTVRLNNFLDATRKLEYEKILDYTYPKLFQNVSRDELLRSMKAGFESRTV